jgi:hypothetical protein
MMGRDKLTPIEIEILTAMIERAEIASKLTTTCLRMRRARFLMRRLIKVEYLTLDRSQRFRAIVSPLNYLLEAFAPS